MVDLNVEHALISCNREDSLFVCYFIIERKLQMEIYSLPPTRVCMCKTKIKAMFPSWKGVEVEDDFKLEIMSAIEASNEDIVATKGQRGEANSWSWGI